MTTLPSPLPPGVSAELRRLTERWRALPLEQARRRTASLRGLVDELAAATAPSAGPPPDLGPAALADQVAVLVHDAAAAGEDPQRLEARLAHLRRAL